MSSRHGDGSHDPSGDPSEEHDVVLDTQSSNDGEDFATGQSGFGSGQTGLKTEETAIEGNPESENIPIGTETRQTDSETNQARGSVSCPPGTGHCKSGEVMEVEGGVAASGGGAGQDEEAWLKFNDVQVSDFVYNIRFCAC